MVGTDVPTKKGKAGQESGEIAADGTIGVVEGDGLQAAKIHTGLECAIEYIVRISRKVAACFRQSCRPMERSDAVCGCAQSEHGLALRRERTEGGSDRERDPPGPGPLAGLVSAGDRARPRSGSPTNASKRGRGIFVETLPIPGTRHGSAPWPPGCGKGGRLPPWQGAGGLRGRGGTSRHGRAMRRAGARARSRGSACRALVASRARDRRSRTPCRPLTRRC